MAAMDSAPRSGPPSTPRARKPNSLAEAQAFIRQQYRAVTGTEMVALEAASGRILARDLQAPWDLPRQDLSAMDGYAIRSADLDGEGRARLRLAGLAAAGHPPERALAPGEAMRIFTGALLPQGVDRVVVQEQAVSAGDWVTLTAPLGGKPHIRRRGEDLARGSLLVAAGTVLGPGQLALLAACQIASLPVRRRLRVALASTGDELQEGAGPLGPGRIADSNRPMLRAALAQSGCELADLGILPDDPQALLPVLIEAAAAHDLIITSGGASVGAADHLHRLIAARGHLEFWRLNMRPGKPVGLGDIDDCPLLALPGNPMAAAVGFALLGRCLIGCLAGDARPRPEVLTLPLAWPLSKAPGRLEVLAGRRVTLTAGTVPRAEAGPFGGESPGLGAVEPLAVQGSASLAALSQAEGLILLPTAPDHVPAGHPVRFVAL